MLIHFTVANFKSIKKAQTFSLVEAKGKAVADTQTFDVSHIGGCSGLKLLPAAGIYGANAAGKSNLLEALYLMRRIVRESFKHQHRGDFLPVKSFKLDPATRNAPVEFEVIFIAEGVRYQYGFSATRERVVHEWLLAYPKNRRQDWLSREWDEKKKKHLWHLGASMVGEKKLWQKSTRDNALFLSTAVQLNGQQLQPVFDWFNKTICMVGITGWNPNFSASFCDTKDNKEKILEYLKAADLDIDNILVEKVAFDRDKVSESLPKSLREDIIQDLESKNFYKTQTVHQDIDGKPVVFDIEEESSGTQKLFSFAGPWIDVLAKGRVLFVDELNNSLHPRLVEFLVSLFNNKKTNPNNAQLVFTSHDTAIISQKIMRREQIWFCEKDKFQVTKIYPLSVFIQDKKFERWGMMYLSGSYGALPYIEKVGE